MWSLCGYHTFLLLIIKLHFSVVCEARSLACLLDSTFMTFVWACHEKERFSCLIIQISCYLMAHIIIIKRETGEASANNLSLVDEVKVPLVSSLSSGWLDYLNIFLISFLHERFRRERTLLWMSLMMIYEFLRLKRWLANTSNILARVRCTGKEWKARCIRS